MSITLPRNFDRLVARNSHLGRALREFAAFVDAHPNWESIDSRLLARALTDIDPWELARAIQILIDVGSIRQAYKVTTPSGSLSDATFDSPLEVPAKLPDRFEEYFETSEQDIVPVIVSAER